MDIQDLLAKFNTAKKSGNGWMTKCPGHKDKTASLHITEGSSGNILMKCFAGCSFQHICDSMGIDPKDMFAHTEQEYDTTENTNVTRKIKRRKKRPAPVKPSANILEQYEYIRLDGEVAMRSVRYAPAIPKKFRQRGPNWENSVKGIRKIPFKLTELVNAVKDKQTIFVCEGEKDVLNVIDLGLAATTNAGGAQNWQKSFSKYLKNANVVILEDNDDAGRKRSVMICNMLQGHAASIKVVALPGLENKGDVSDWIENGGSKQLLLDIVNKTNEWKPVVEEMQNDNRTEIPIFIDQIKPMTRALEKVLANTGKIFSRAGMLTHITYARDFEENSEHYSAIYSPKIIPLQHISITSLAAEHCKFKHPEKFNYELPPTRVVSDLMSKGSWRHIKNVEGIIESPTIKPNGDIVNGICFDEQLQYFVASRIKANVSDNPTRLDAKDAVGLVAKPLCDFPFNDDSSKYAAIAAMMSTVVRPIIHGPVPMFAIGATTPGSGKTLLADVISTVATGHKAPKVSSSGNNEEDIKVISSIALKGAPIVLIDNIDRQFGNQAWASTLTAGIIEGRLLGKNEMFTMNYNAVTLCTGNGLSFRGDLGRRIIPINIEVKEENPETRTGFKYKDVLKYIRKNRKQFLSAILTIVKAYLIHVKNGGDKIEFQSNFGSFESWSDVVRASIFWASGIDVCAGKEKVRNEADQDVISLRRLLSTWHEAYGEKEKTIAEVIRDKEEEVDVYEALSYYDYRATASGNVSARRVGQALTKLKGRRTMGMYLKAVYGGRMGIRWSVVNTRKPEIVETEQDAQDAQDVFYF